MAKTTKRKVRKLVLGSDGRLQRSEGWVHNDLYRTDSLNEDDIVHDARYINEVVEEGCVEQLHATHLLEHFSHRETQNVLRNWHLIMKPGGTIYIEVPNLDWFVDLYNNMRYEELIRYMFGGQEDDGDYHKTAFNASLITQHLKAAGFKSVQVTNAGNVISVYAKA